MLGVWVDGKGGVLVIENRFRIGSQKVLEPGRNKRSVARKLRASKYSEIVIGIVVLIFSVLYFGAVIGVAIEQIVDAELSVRQIASRGVSSSVSVLELRCI